MSARGRTPGAAPALIETLAVEDAGPRHLELHLERLAGSAAALGHRVDIGAVRRALAGERPAGAVGSASVSVVRLELAADGTFAITRRQVPADDGRPVLLAIDEARFDPSAVVTRHKTTDRARFAAARARHPEADDVVLVNAAGNVAETTIANLAVRIDGRWWTPPLTDGALPGIGRRLALEAGEVVERSISAEELRAAEQVAVVSSVRRWRSASAL